MKIRLVWFLAPAVLVAFLCFCTQPAMAQAPPPDPGQQGEFTGENVDTGAAALDTGPEATELSEAGVEANETTESPEAGVEAKESPSALSTHISAVGTTSPTAQDLDVDDGAVNDGNFDLQEISEVDTPGAK